MYRPNVIGQSSQYSIQWQYQCISQMIKIKYINYGEPCTVSKLTCGDPYTVLVVATGCVSS